MGAGVDAVEAESAIHAARLPRLEQVQFAAGYSLSAADAILGLALGACFWVQDLHFQRRHQRLHEVKLTDRTDILTKRRASKKTADYKGCDEEADRNPRDTPCSSQKGTRS